jgi:hypothetical protein
LAYGNPFEIEKPDIKYSIRFGGKVEKKMIKGKEKVI